MLHENKRRTFRKQHLENIFIMLLGPQMFVIKHFNNVI